MYSFKYLKAVHLYIVYFLLAHENYSFFFHNHHRVHHYRPRLQQSQAGLEHALRLSVGDVVMGEVVDIGKDLFTGDFLILMYASWKC